MNLYIDNEIFIRQKNGGISRVFKNLIYLLTQVEDIQLNDVYNIKNNSLRLIWEIFGIKNMRKAVNYSADVIHESYYGLKYYGSFKGKIIITVHDMIYEKFPEYFRKYDFTAFNKRIAIERCDKIICVSNSTKNDLLEYYPKTVNKIEVINPIIFKFKNDKISNKLFNSNYILYVGNRHGYKNFKILLKAFSILVQHKSDIKLICVGGEKLNDDETTFIIDNKLDQKIVFIHPTDYELNSLYKNALCLVMTSIYEGYGLTGVEALLSGTTVFTSDHNTAREVYQNNAIYFNFREWEDLFSKLYLFICENKIQYKINYNSIYENQIRLNSESLKQYIKLLKALCEN